MNDRRIRKFERAEAIRVAKLWCVGLGFLSWLMALTTVFTGQSNPRATSNSVFPALVSTGEVSWLFWPMILIGIGLFVLAGVLGTIFQD